MYERYNSKLHIVSKTGKLMKKESLNKLLSYRSIGRLVLIVSFASTLAACAHQRHTGQANDYLQQGRYELAVREYQQALKLKSSNIDNRQRMKIAQAELDRWLAKVRAGADQAYDHQQLAKALLLYGKIVQLQSDPQSLGRYQQLLDQLTLLLYGKIVQLQSDPQSLGRYQQLLDQLTRQHALKVNLHYDPLLMGVNFADNLQGIDIQAGQNAVDIVIALTDYQSTNDYLESVQSQEYLSGIETLVNPNYLYTQNRIGENRVQVKKLRKKLKRYQSRKRSLNAAIERVQLTITQHTSALASENLQPDKYARLERALGKALQSKVGFVAKREENQRALDKYQRRYHHAEHDLNEAYERLADLPPTVDQEVFDVYSYMLGTLRQSMSVDVLIEQQGRRHIQTAMFSRSDSEHSGHPAIGLSDKDAIELSSRQMRAEANKSAATLARIYLQEQRDAHRHILALKRQRETHPAEQLELAVGYLLAGDQSRDATLESEVRLYLSREYGVAGEFPVHHLLNLYKPAQ